jgi:putative membrane protein
MSVSERGVVMNRRMILLAAAATAAAGPALAQTPRSGEAETTHANKTAQIGGASLVMANIALDKASSAKVKEFAQFEHNEQTLAGAILKSMDPSLNPPSPPPDVAAAIDKLKQMKPGEAFDHEFVTAQIQGHNLLRTIQEDYLKVGHDPDAVNTTKLIHLMIGEHLTLLSDLDKNLREL